ncbi:MAG: DinB family protein [Candidatus Dormibacteraeota bacterium]|nr:DinB family protein [Candidatus Dormibacteraeota bacterium]
MGSAIIHVVHHNNWANSALVDFLAALPDDRLDLTSPGNYGTIRLTLNHLVSSQVRYVSAATSEAAPEGLPRRGEWSGFEAIRNGLAWTAPRLVVLGETATEAEDVEWVHPGGVEHAKLATVVVQAIHHAQEHRTNITTILAAAGIEAPELSAWAYGEVTWG